MKDNTYINREKFKFRMRTTKYNPTTYSNLTKWTSRDYDILNKINQKHIDESYNPSDKRIKSLPPKNIIKRIDDMIRKNHR